MMNSKDTMGTCHCTPTFFSCKAHLLFLLYSVCLILPSWMPGVVTARAADVDHGGPVNCDLHRGPCTQKLGDTRVVLDVSPRPVKAMTDLLFRIRFEGTPPAATPYIDLGMPGMKMGPNRVSLHPVGKGVYEGAGVIVRCPSGKRIWKARVTIPDAGFVEFVFDVIY